MPKKQKTPCPHLNILPLSFSRPPAESCYSIRCLVSDFRRPVTKPHKESLTSVRKGDCSYRKKKPSKQNTYTQTRTHTHHALEGGKEKKSTLPVVQFRASSVDTACLGFYCFGRLSPRLVCARPFIGLLKTGGAHGAERLRVSGRTRRYEGESERCRVAFASSLPSPTINREHEAPPVMQQHWRPRPRQAWGEGWWPGGRGINRRRKGGTWLMHRWGFFLILLFCFAPCVFAAMSKAECCSSRKGMKPQELRFHSPFSLFEEKNVYSITWPSNQLQDTCMQNDVTACRQPVPSFKPPLRWLTMFGQLGHEVTAQASTWLCQIIHSVNPSC